MHDFSDWMINSRFFYPLPAIERLVTHVYNGKEKACAFTICTGSLLCIVYPVKFYCPHVQCSPKKHQTTDYGALEV